MNFTALEDFWSDETQSQYCAGLSYTARTDELASLVERWIDAGKVELSDPLAQVNGQGSAQWR